MSPVRSMSPYHSPLEIDRSEESNISQLGILERERTRVFISSCYLKPTYPPPAAFLLHQSSLFTMAVQESTGGISCLADDIMWDVFGRLPAKSIGRSRCVSKRWLSLTTDPQFVGAYPVDIDSFYLCCIFTEPELFHVLDRSVPSTHPILSSTFKRRGRYQYYPGIIHSCNGLLLCRLYEHYGVLYVCNPTTKKHVEIPYPAGLHEPDFLNFSLAFHPSTCPRFKIFAGEYLIRNPTDDLFTFSSYVIYRFSSETWSWERILTLDGHPYLSNFHRLPNAYWNGYLCWITKGRLECLDVNTETMTRLSLPPPLCPPAPTMECVYAGTPDGRRLHCCASSSSKSWHVHDMDVYEMESMSSGWTLLYHVDLRGVVDVFPEAMDERLHWCVWVKIFWLFRGRQGQEEEDILVLAIPRNIVVYSLKHKTFSKISDGSRPNASFDQSWLRLYPHAYSLFPM